MTNIFLSSFGFVASFYWYVTAWGLNSLSDIDKQGYICRNFRKSMIFVTMVSKVSK